MPPARAASRVSRALRRLGHSTPPSHRARASRFEARASLRTARRRRRSSVASELPSRTRSWGVGLALPLKRQMAAFAVGAFASAAARASPALARRASEPRFAKPRAAVVVRAGESSISEKLELTADNVEKVLDEVRPYLIADGATWSWWRSTGWWCD